MLYRRLPRWSLVKNTPADAGDIRDVGLISGLGKSLEKEMATHSSILAWRIGQRSLAGYSPARRTRLKRIPTHTHAIRQDVVVYPSYFSKIASANSNLLVHPAEKAMALHSSTLAWKIPWMEEPGRLQSMGSLRVRHD